MSDLAHGIGDEWKLMNGAAPHRADLPGSDRKLYIEIRPMRRTPREQFEEMEGRARGDDNGRRPVSGREMTQHLVDHSLLDFLLPSHDGQIRANPEDVAKRTEQLEDAPPTLCAWMYEELFAINGRNAHAKLLRMTREGLFAEMKPKEAKALIEQWRGAR